MECRCAAKIPMTQANEPNDRNRSLDRQLRVFERRITRLEETQLTGKEVSLAFDRVYDEIDALEEQMNVRFDRLESEIGEIRVEMREMRVEMNGKIDVILRHITGEK
jgi:hypothetical protein